MAKRGHDSGELSNRAKFRKSQIRKLGTSSEANDGLWRPKLGFAKQNPMTSSELGTTTPTAHNMYRPVSQNLAKSRPNETSTLDKATPQMEECITNRKTDVRNNLESEALDVVCLVGMGQYNKGIQQRLPSWLNDCNEDRSIGLFKCIVEGMSGQWTAHIHLSYGVVSSSRPPQCTF